MNILDVIKNCIINPYFLKDYDIDAISNSKESLSDDKTSINSSVFSGYSTLKNSSLLSMDQHLLRVYMRIWNALGLSLKQVLLYKNCFVIPDLGYFFPSNQRFGMTIFSPFTEVCEKYNCTLIADDFNVFQNGLYVRFC